MSSEEERIYVDENDELRTDEEYEKLLPPLSPSEYKALEKSMLRDGQLKPLVANQRKIVLDGVHRLQICRKHGIKPKYVKRKFANRLEEKEFILKTNLIHRQLTKFQRIEAALPLIEIEKERAKLRKLSTLKKGEDAPDPQNFGERGEALKIVAEQIAVSHETVRQALYLMEHASKEELDKLRRGEKSIHRLYVEINNKSKEKEAGGMPRYVAKLLEPPKRNYKVKINIYGNTDLASIMLERTLLERIAEKVHALGGRPEYIIIRALEEYDKKLERAMRALNPYKGNNKDAAASPPQGNNNKKKRGKKR